MKNTFKKISVGALMVLLAVVAIGNVRVYAQCDASGENCTTNDFNASPLPGSAVGGTSGTGSAPANSSVSLPASQTGGTSAGSGSAGGSASLPASQSGGTQTAPPASTVGGTTPLPVSTVGGTNGSGSSGSMLFLQNPLSSQFTSVGGIVQGALDIFSYVVVLFAVLMIIYVGLQFVLAQGKPERLSELKGWLLWIVIGVAVVIGARIIVSVVLNTLQATNTVSPSVIQNANNALNGR